jgi:SAM-dependent methyltransferase
MVARARRTFGDDDRLSFDIGDARHTGLADASFDLVVMHTLLCHVPHPSEVLDEAFRLLRPGGTLAICDGDYSTATTGIADFDPLDQLVRYLIDLNVANLWIMRQVSGMLARTGFMLGARIGHGYVAEGEATYFLTVIDRAADRLVEDGVLFPETGEAMKAEARRRVSASTFFGFMSYVSQIATKPRAA